MILTENTPEITPRKEYTPAPMKPLNAGLLAPMRRYHINLGGLRADQAGTRRFKPIHTAFPRAQVAVGEMRVGLRAFLGCVNGRKEGVPRDVVVEEILRGNPEEAPRSERDERGCFHGASGKRAEVSRDAVDGHGLIMAMKDEISPCWK